MILQNEVLGTETKFFRIECLRWGPKGKGDFRKEEAGLQNKYYLLCNFAHSHLDSYTTVKTCLITQSTKLD